MLQIPGTRVSEIGLYLVHCRRRSRPTWPTLDLRLMFLCSPRPLRTHLSHTINSIARRRAIVSGLNATLFWCQTSENTHLNWLAKHLEPEWTARDPHYALGWHQKDIRSLNWICINHWEMRLKHQLASIATFWVGCFLGMTRTPDRQRSVMHGTQDGRTLVDFEWRMGQLEQIHRHVTPPRVVLGLFRNSD